MYCSPWGRKELDTAERTELNWETLELFAQEGSGFQ